MLKTIDNNRTTNAGLAGRLAAIGGSAAFGYVTIFLLQLKAIWGIWEWRDLTLGDTSSYFVMAHNWFSIGRGDFAWSPLYTFFYGMLLHFSSDAYVVTILHRAILVLALAVLVLALMRRLLPPGYAWIAAAWWVVLPIDFNTLYEVHLFAVIPLLLAALTVLWIPGRWGRGWCFAILVVDAFLVRNEILVATLLFGAGAIGWEYWRYRDGGQRPSGWMRGYAVPLCVACALVVVCFVRNSRRDIAAAFSHKALLNFCQVYAFGYQQRHSDWQGSPWLGCRQLMHRNFGLDMPSLLQAFGRNPAAVLEHFSWNTSLTPSGLQVLLVNAMSGNFNPDYAAVIRYPAVAIPASLLILAVVLSGGYVLYKDWSYWWNTLLKPRAWAWFAMSCITLVVPVIILTQRPRPSYLLAFGIFLRAAIGVCTVALLRRIPRLRLNAAVGPIAVLLLIAIMPSYYVFRHQPRPMRDRYEAIAPFRHRLDSPDTVFSTDSFPDELRSYLAPGSGGKSLSFSDLRRQVTPQLPLKAVLKQNHVNLLFADDAMLADPAVREFLAEAKSEGWQLIGSSQDPAWPWSLWARNTAAAAAEWNFPPDVLRR